jgi:rubrerythrin
MDLRPRVGVSSVPNIRNIKGADMKKTIALLALLTLFTLGTVLAADSAAPASATPAAKAPKAAKVVKKAKPAAQETWVCPMGDYKGPKTKDGKCPNCKMDLLKLQEKKGGDKAGAKVEGSKPAPKASEGKKVVWTCPMCGGSYDKPGKCPDCGMDLVKKN